ncbi:AMP-binding protein [Microbacterium resistens]|uniref:AMP-binding protein n=1 Tax=Microbacterium resistens TaxID=156977 RepID=A0ABY3RXB4_9MICO|nr:AMP-binding protein [Microbacterium resistens]UGS27541.1 AMP-binding protein [Microbacterium resistens]
MRPTDTPRDVSTADAVSLWHLLSLRAAATGAAVALRDEHGRTETFADVAGRAERVAAGLRDLGIGPGAVVSWQLPTRIDTIVLSLALSRLGVVQNPIIPLYREREVTAMVAQCGTEWLITIPEFRGFDHAAMAHGVRAASGDRVEVIVLGETLPDGDPASLPPAPEGRDEVRWIYTTSGTTSAPKGVCHADGTLIAGGSALAAAIEATASDVATVLFPYAHIGGPDMLVASLVSGMSLVLMEVYEPAAAVALMRDAGVTVTGGSTPHYALLLEQQRKAPGTVLVPTLRILAGGGAPMPESLFRDVLAEMGVPVLHAYGMTECPMITSARVGDSVEHLATTSGRPVQGCEVEIRSEEGDALAAGEAGRVWLRGEMRFLHYLVDGQPVAPFDAEGWLFTGDVGRLDPDGHLVLVGREKDLIIRKGETISPAEIEDVLAAHPGIADVAVLGLPDERTGERICAVLVAAPGGEAPDLAAVREHCRASGISPAKFPEQVVLVDEMPKTPTMKIRKQVLRESVSDAALAVPTAG